MQIITAYIVSAVVFLGLDAVMLRSFMKPLFQRHIGDWLLETPRYGPAVVFYLAYVAGGVYLVSRPALAADAPTVALLHGALLGALAYGTYEFTNLSTLTRWSWQQVIVDTSWGTALTGVSLWLGVLAARAIA